jgi:hypothetical protein
MSSPTILTSKLLSTIDGKSFGVDGPLIRALLIIRTRLSHILFGVKKIGLYSYQNEMYTAKDLYDMEQRELFSAQTQQELLRIVKLDFAEKIEPFLELSNGSKPQMLILVEESLKLHRRQNSFLHKRAQAPESDNKTLFHREVQSFGDLYYFLHDLLNFLDDMISSCPKARTQFIAALKTEKERQLYLQRFTELFERQKHKINTRA